MATFDFPIPLSEGEFFTPPGGPTYIWKTPYWKIAQPLGEPGPPGPQGPAGPTGATGPANALAIGTVTTVPVGGAATSTITGTPPSQTLNLGLPTGATGSTGSQGPAGTNGAGVVPGGTAGQVLTKIDATNYNTSWQTPPGAGGGIADVPDAENYVRTLGSWVLGYTKAAIDTLLGGKAPIASPVFTGIVDVAPGTTAAPSLTFGTGNSGIWGSGSGGTATINVTMNGTTRLTVIPSRTTVTSNLFVTSNVTTQSNAAIPAGGTAGSGFMFSSVANFGTFFGSGAPTLSAAKGSQYLRSDGSSGSYTYVNTDGTTTWAPLADTAYVTAGDALKVAKAGDTMTGNLTVSPAAGNGDLIVNSIAAQNSSYWLSRAGLKRWEFRANTTAESGSNNGTNLNIVSYADDGSTPVVTALAITRSTGVVSVQQLNSTAKITANNAAAMPSGGNVGIGYLMTSTANFGTFAGSGAPTLSAAKGSHYYRSDGSVGTYTYVNTDGATTWAPLLDSGAGVLKTGDTMTGNLSITPPSGYASIGLNKPASGQGNQIVGQTAGKLRWAILPGDAVTEGAAGANVGSHFHIERFSDDASPTWIDNPLTISRTTGIVAMPDGATTLTPPPGDNDTSVATTAFVTAADVAADALKVSKAGDTMTGNLRISVADAQLGLLINGGTKGVRFVANGTSMAIEGVDQTGAGSYQPLTIGNTTGTVLIGSNQPPAGDNTTKVATTAFVATAIGSAPVVPNIANGTPDSTTNWDSIPATAGWFPTLLGTGNTNAPHASQYFACLTVLFSTGSHILQMAVPYGLSGSVGVGLYYRGRFSGTWGAWRNLLAIDATGILNASGFITSGDVTVAANAAAAQLTLSKTESVTGANIGIRMVISGASAAVRSSTTATTSTAHALYYNPNGNVGTISTSGSATAYTTTSDERLKDIDGSYDPAEAIAIIRADPVRSFTWKATGEEAIGWIAQQSYAVDERLAVPPAMDAEGKQLEEHDRWGIDYGKRTPYLWAALTNALDRIEQLEARLTLIDPKP